MARSPLAPLFGWTRADYDRATSPPPLPAPREPRGVELLRQALEQPPAWMADASCREHPEVDFYPSRGESTAEAKAVCRGCLVRSECLEYALRNGDKHGIWGGLSEHERRPIRRRRRTAA